MLCACTGWWALRRLLAGVPARPQLAVCCMLKSLQAAAPARVLYSPVPAAADVRLRAAGAPRLRACSSLSDNQLSGRLPAEWSAMKSLEGLCVACWLRARRCVARSAAWLLHPSCACCVLLPAGALYFSISPSPHVARHTDALTSRLLQVFVWQRETACGAPIAFDGSLA
jgi:hypothetical protein